MIFYGMQKTSMVDFPSEVATTLFTGGCNMRCPFCHNPGLITPVKEDLVEIDEIISHLKKRKNVISAVAITGGEPLMHGERLIDFISEVKNMGFKVKVDTNGTFPDILSKLDVDYVAMDFKTSFDKYHLMHYTGKGDLRELILQSLSILEDSGVDYEIRTTLVPGIVDNDDIDKMMPFLKGVPLYVLNQFRPNSTLDPAFHDVVPYLKEDIEEMLSLIAGYGVDCEVRPPLV